MTRTVVCSVRDSASQAFAQPMFLPTTGYAGRMFADEVNRAAPDNNLNKHPGDFELWLIAEYDEVTGSFFEPDGGRRCIVRAADVVSGS